MDIDANRLDWNHLRAFLASAEAKTLSGGAARLGLTQPTLSRQIAALETQLGLTLFERVGRGLEITDAGRELLVHIQEMGEAAHRATLATNGLRNDLSGWVRITASDIMATQLLPQTISQLRQIAPQLKVEVIATNDIVDLLHREADIAIRHIRPTEPSLIARRVAELKAYLYGHEDLIARGPTPLEKTNLGELPWVAYGDAPRMITYMKHLNIELEEHNFTASSDDGLIAWEMVKSGLGISPMDAHFGDKHPQLRRILPDEIEITFPIWLVAHRELQTSPKIRLVFDVLAQVFARHHAG